MAAAPKSRLDMKHGFMQKIIQNQVDRQQQCNYYWNNMEKPTPCELALNSRVRRIMFKSRDIRFYPAGDNYDKEVKAKISEKPKRFSFQPPRNKRPDAATYIPPPRLEDNNQASSEEDDLPKTLFVFEFEDKDGKVFRQYVKEGVRAELLAQRMGYDRKLKPPMIQALQDRLQEEIDKRTKKS